MSALRCLGRDGKCWPKKLGLQAGNIVSRGEFSSHSQVDIDNFDGLLITSLFEGFPLVAIEALASSLPIVSTDFGGLRDELGELAELIAIEDSLDLTAANFGLAMDLVQRRPISEQKSRWEAMKVKFDKNFPSTVFRNRINEILS